MDGWQPAVRIKINRETEISLFMFDHSNLFYGFLTAVPEPEQLKVTDWPPAEAVLVTLKFIVACAPPPGS